MLRIRRVPGRAWVWFRNRYRGPIHMFQRFAQSFWHRRSLNIVQDNTHRVGKNDILLFATLRNEVVRMPFFLNYYRSLGVKHFFLVDNGSTDGFRALVANDVDVSVWHTEASYSDSNFGMHWMNALLRRYGCEHWCVTCDPDEFLVYPRCDERNLSELAEFLESEHRRSLCCLMLDMYSDKPVSETRYVAGQDPFETAPYFDGSGYTQVDGFLGDVYTRGGVRRRVFFNDYPEAAPALNKTPFVKWRWTYSYFMSMHQLVPPWLNVPHDPYHPSPTGCVMHFKYFSILGEKAREEIGRGEHWNDSFEYKRYHNMLEEADKPLIYEGSVRYRDWRQLAEKGFLSLGQWF